ncbi:hypothetical protein FOMPIDRAFT_1025993 [Fomitopsis schrenkii]|uniref:CFEM domain-containing protein n=1 Tax=Fomitopsis schrenkii TaxID=2126942 RepID=S8F812_FOMSC|nr:hypothetical protein FOMPIDRAFT_1025993 [Fomitopsis schrenkii]
MFSSLPLSLLLVVSSACSFVAAQSSTSETVSSSAATSTSASSGATATSTGSESRSGSSSGSATSTASLPSFSGYSTCVDECIDSAVAFTGCSSVAAVDCYCSASNSTIFAQNLTSCLASNCPSSISPAESLANRLCAVASQSTSISFATTSISASSSSASSSGLNTTSHSATTSHSTSASPSTTGTGAGVRQSVDGKLVASMAAGLAMAALGVLSGL